MRKGILVFGIVGVFGALAILPVQAREAALVDPPYKDLRSASSITLTPAHIEEAIRYGAVTREWTVLSSDAERVQLRLNLRSHSVDVAVRYDDHGFDIDYVSSQNLEYQIKDGQALIHPNYNVWISRLSDTIAVAPALDPTRPPLDAAIAGPLAPVRKLKLVAPVHVNRQLMYRPGLEVNADIKRCEWNTGYGKALQERSAGLVELTDTPPRELKGYSVESEVVNVYSAGGAFFSGRKWSFVRNRLYEDGKLIGTQVVRSQTGGKWSGCATLNKMAIALAGQTFKWLNRGAFQVRELLDENGVPIESEDDIDPEEATAQAP